MRRFIYWAIALLIIFALVLFAVRAMAAGPDAAQMPGCLGVTQSTTDGLQLNVCAGDNQTDVGVDIYLDGIYTESHDFIGSLTLLDLPNDTSWCEVSVAAWRRDSNGIGFGHSHRAGPLVNPLQPACSSTAVISPITTPSGSGICVDTIVYDAVTNDVFSQQTQCF